MTSVAHELQVKQSADCLVASAMNHASTVDKVISIASIMFPKDRCGVITWRRIFKDARPWAVNVESSAFEPIFQYKSAGGLSGCGSAGGAGGCGHNFCSVE